MSRSLAGRISGAFASESAVCAAAVGISATRTTRGTIQGASTMPSASSLSPTQIVISVAARARSPSTPRWTADPDLGPSLWISPSPVSLQEGLMPSASPASSTARVATRAVQR